jgi:pimeloyl-ACP methyl ester carboxylesterase
MSNPSRDSRTCNSRAAWALCFTVLWALAGAAWAQERPGLEPCRVRGLEQEVLCGKLTRPLDPAAASGAKIDIHYAVLPAQARNRHADPVFVLAGGPGQSAIALAPAMRGVLSRLNNRRDLVFVDQRGTGRSAPLMCDDERQRSLADMADPRSQLKDVLERCLPALRALPHGDLRHYTTTLAVQDLDAVRAQLGAPQVNLVGGSYGTRVGLEYLRQFPAAVRRAYLDGIAPPDMALADSLSADAQAALDAVFDACDREPACTQRHPALRERWSALLAGLPRATPVAHPLTGQVETVTFAPAAVLSMVRVALYAPTLASALPPAIAAAADGRFEPLVGLSSAGGGARAATRLAMGMHFSVVCAEDLADAAKADRPPGRDFGATFAQQYREICAQWPRAAVDAAFYRVGASPAPVLLTSGGIDPVTPPRHGERMARSLGAKAVHLVVPNAGHGVMTLPCMRDAILRFFDARDDAEALAVDAACANAVPRPGAFAPVRLEGAR